MKVKRATGKSLIAEISSLTRKLKSSLPKTKLRARLHKHEEKVKKSEIKEEIKKMERAVKEGKTAAPAPIKIPKPPAATELEKLERELSEIESRLTRLV